MTFAETTAKELVREAGQDFIRDIASAPMGFTAQTPKAG
jgi:hypothetical protein